MIGLLLITRVNINNYLCVCKYHVFTITLKLTEVGTRVHTIVTSDPDIGDAGSVEFFIISNGDIVTVSASA